MAKASFKIDLDPSPLQDAVRKLKALNANDREEVMKERAFAKEIQFAISSSPAKDEIRVVMDRILGPGTHSYENLAKAALEAMIEVGDEQLRELALLIDQENG